jgi:hypothetical protein
MLAQQVWTSYLRRFTELCSVRLPFSTELGEKPRASRLARWQANQGRQLFSRKHQVLRIDDLGREIVRKLDGTHDVASIMADLEQMMAAGRLKVEASQTLSQSQLVAALRQAVDQILRRFASDGVLASESAGEPQS